MRLPLWVSGPMLGQIITKTQGIPLLMLVRRIFQRLSRSLEIPFKGCVRKRPKHETTSSYFT